MIGTISTTEGDFTQLMELAVGDGMAMEVSDKTVTLTMDNPDGTPAGWPDTLILFKRYALDHGWLLKLNDVGATHGIMSLVGSKCLDVYPGGASTDLEVGVVCQSCSNCSDMSRVATAIPILSERIDDMMIALTGSLEQLPAWGGLIDDLNVTMLTWTDLILSRSLRAMGYNRGGRIGGALSYVHREAEGAVNVRVTLTSPGAHPRCSASAQYSNGTPVDLSSDSNEIVYNHTMKPGESLTMAFAMQDQGHADAKASRTVNISAGPLSTVLTLPYMGSMPTEELKAVPS